MTRWHAMDPIDESFFKSAPHVYRYTYDLPVPPERVWASLDSDNSVADWTPLLSKITWTSPRPHGVGTTREVLLPARAARIREHFFLWDEGRRFAFHGTEATLPLLRHFAEDYLVEPNGAGSRFTWTFALEGTPRTRLLLKAMNPVNAVQFRQMSGGCKSYFAKQMAPRRSAGLLLYRRTPAGIEVLLGHMGGPFFARKDDGAWSIPKGEYDEDEAPLDAARREFSEEFGAPAPAGEYAELGEVRQRNGKLVTAWAVEGELEASSIVSNTFETEWPPRSGRTQAFPEVDRAEWFDLATARRKMIVGQGELLDRLSERLA